MRFLCRLGIHDWGKWEEYLWEGKVCYTPRFIVPTPSDWHPFSELRQKRECVDCGIKQERTTNETR